MNCPRCKPLVVKLRIYSVRTITEAMAMRYCRCPRCKAHRKTVVVEEMVEELADNRPPPTLSKR